MSLIRAIYIGLLDLVDLVWNAALSVTMLMVLFAVVFWVLVDQGAQVLDLEINLFTHAVVVFGLFWVFAAIRRLRHPNEDLV